MSVRPRTGQPNPGRGGDGRRRRWSESPVPRPGVRRVRAAGVAVPVYAWADWNDVDIDTGLDLQDSSTPVAGQTAVAMIGAKRATIALPTGWTSLLEGSVGDLNYHIGYRYLTGGDSFQVTMTPAYTTVGVMAGYADAVMWGFTGGGTPAVTVAESVDTYAYVTGPSAGWKAPWNAGLAVVSTTDDELNWGYTPDGAAVPDIVGAWYGWDPGTYIPEVSGFDVDDYVTKSGAGNADFAMFCFGWV